MNSDNNTSFLEMAASIVSAFVSNNAVPSTELAQLIQSVHASIQKIASGVPETIVTEPQEPAVSIKKSVTPDYIICLEDGKKFKSLKRHLKTAYDLSPEAYRLKWNLPRDYPMVAPAYAAARSALAKQSGLGQPRLSATSKKVTPTSSDDAAKRGRGRAKTAAVE